MSPNKRTQAVLSVAALLLTIASSFAFAETSETRIPFSHFAPRPSATTIYCRAALGTNLAGHDETIDDGKVELAYIGAEVFKYNRAGEVNGVNFDMKLVFEGKQLLVSSKMPLDTNHPDLTKYWPSFPYKVYNDDPGNFVAVQDRTNEVGSLQIVSMDRETGTMMLTYTYASLPDRGHPATGATFYACQEHEW